MPIKPAKACAQSNCPGMAVSGEAYCLEHRKESKKYYERDRDVALKNKYASKQWREYRAEKLRRDPLCQDCMERDGSITAASTVHHVREVADGGAFLPAFEETRSVCKSCHGKAHKKGFNREITGFNDKRGGGSKP